MAKLTIIIPVYNEESTILEVVNSVKKAKIKNVVKEIIIVDDFSADRTRDALKSLNDKSIKILYHKKNMGKGAAIKTALQNSTGNIILIQDADLEYDPREYPRLLKPIMEKKAKVVYGSRLDVIKKNLKKMYKLHYIGNVLLTMVTNLLYGSKITDMETGYKVFTRDIVSGMKLKSKRFDFEPEITAKILKRGYRIYEIPIGFKARKFHEGKKITWRDGLKALVYLVKYRFVD